MTDALAQIGAVVKRYSGIALGERLTGLAAAIDRVGGGAGPAEMLALTEDSRHGVALLDRLVDEVTINETFFMRHRSELDAIPWALLLARARRRGHGQVRVWSAACATGEEAYSLAILALEALPGEAAPVSVLATDISQSCLTRADGGHYGVRSLRHVAPELRRRYFRDGEAGTADVRFDLRGRVRLARHNLVADPIPPAGEPPFDVIVCRNVLIYFDTDTAARVVSRLQGALSESGVLVLGATDRLTVTPSGRPALRNPSVEGLRTTSRVSRADPAHLMTPPVVARRRPGAPEPSVVEPPAGLRAPLALALADADAGRLDAALSAIKPILQADPLNTVALCIQGLALHAQGDPTAAIPSLRRAVYLDPAFVRAAFELGRAQDALGDRSAARRAYRQALEGLEQGVVGDPLLGDDDLGLGDACRARLAAAEQVAR